MSLAFKSKLEVRRLEQLELYCRSGRDRFCGPESSESDVVEPVRGTRTKLAKASPKRTTEPPGRFKSSLRHIVQLGHTMSIMERHHTHDVERTGGNQIMKKLARDGPSKGFRYGTLSLAASHQSHAPLSQSLPSAAQKSGQPTCVDCHPDPWQARAGFAARHLPHARKRNFFLHASSSLYDRSYLGLPLQVHCSTNFLRFSSWLHIG